MKNTSVFLVCLLKISLSFGQSNLKLDSLKQELSKANNDTMRVLIYEKMLWTSTNNYVQLEYGFKGFNLAKKIRFDKGAMLCGNSVGFILVEIDYYKAVSILSETKQICERNHNEYELSRTLSYLGYAYNKFDFQNSLNYYRQAKKIMTRLNIPESIIPINTAMGYCFKDWGSLDSALIYLQKGYEYALKVQKPISSNTFYVHFGEVYYKKKQLDLAMNYFRRSIDSLSQSNNENGLDGQAYNGIALIYRDRKQLDSAKFYAKKALKIQQEKNRTVYIIESANLLFELYRNSNPAEALRYHLIVAATKDSLFNQEKAKQVEKLAYEEREREARTQRRIEARETEVQNKIKIYILSGILLALGIFSFILYRNNKNKQRANTLLHTQKAEIDLQREKAEKALVKLKATQNQLVQAEKMASLGELTAGIAHEIQNPLNFVNNFSEMSVELAKELIEEVDKEEMDKVLLKEILSDLTQNQQKINHHGKRASSIVKGMLEHSRTSTGEKELTNINALADEYLRLSYHGLRAKDKSFNSDFKTDFDPDLPKINVIPQDIGRVLLNLINNAFYAVKSVDKPMVVVTTKKDDNQLIISVKDNGFGMTQEVKAKVFQPFFTTKPTGQGTGLGLSLAYDIVTKGHGGTIEVESEEGEGTTFIVKLPIV